MGALTRDAVVLAGLNIAGRTDLSTLANVWLNAWLRSQYGAWPWPFLYRRITGLALNAGTTSLTIGAGNGGITPEIQEVRDPLWVYTSDYGKRGKARIRELLDGEISFDETVNNPATNRGMPTRFKIRANPTTIGAWDLIPGPVPDVSYLLAIDYIEQPVDITLGTTRPLYPNDRTMIQFIVSAALQYLDRRADYAKENDVLTEMAVYDRVKYGGVTGTNDASPLDGGTFL
jgi:hypothetical protein